MSCVTLLLAILAVGFLIVVHEGGHYFVARWCHMRIERFSIGFGPAILKAQSKKTGTTFQLAPIPFGGFVEIRGMNIAEDIDPDDAHAYPNRPAWQRFVTIFAGPATNYLSAIALAMALYTCHGLDDRVAVDGVLDGFDATSKLQPGDRIRAVNHKQHIVDGPGGLRLLGERVQETSGAPMIITVERGGVERDLTITPQLEDVDILRSRRALDQLEQLAPSLAPYIAAARDTVPLPAWRDNERAQRALDQLAKLVPSLAPYTAAASKRLPAPVWRIGVIQRPDITRVGVVDAARQALHYPVIQTKVIGGMLYGIVFGNDKADPGGPIRMVEELQRQFSQGMVPGIKLLMALSVYLGLFNLLPIPALDGGRLVFLAYELVTRRRANPKIEAMVHMAGIMALAVVMILVLIVDIRRFI